MNRLRQNLIPPSGLPRLYATLSLLLGIGRGAFLTLSALYFLNLVGLRPWQIGVGFSAAAGAAVLTSVPLSRLADKQSPRTTWLVGLILEAALFATYPWVRGFWAFLVVVVGLELSNTLNYGGRNVYMMEAQDPETRVITQAFGRSWLNVGWGLGALIAAATAAGPAVGWAARTRHFLPTTAAPTVVATRFPPRDPIIRARGAESARSAVE